MGAMTLLVERRGAELSLSRNGEVVSLRYPDGKQHRVGLYALQRIVVHGDINLSTTLLRAAQEAKVSIVLLPARGKGNHVDLFPYLFRHVKRRQAQYRAYFDESLRLTLAKKAVKAKILAQSSWLNQHDLQHDFEKSLAHVQKAPNNAALMGIEGSVTKQYFALWRQLWEPAWGFKERNRRPPRDPVNALLSLGYTLAGNSVGHLVGTYRLDNSFGFLHTPKSFFLSCQINIG
jgi:CRISPR-associated protein Cas1